MTCVCGSTSPTDELPHGPSPRGATDAKRSPGAQVAKGPSAHGGYPNSRRYRRHIVRGLVERPGCRTPR